MPAMELILVIRARLAALESGSREALIGGHRAALWRAQQHAARRGSSLEDVRRYCLESLRPRLLDERYENDYLRGFRQGFQAVLSDIRRLETRRR
jgi:hypothetical protein